FGRYSQVASESALTGAEAARRVLDSAGLHHMPIYETPGRLTDHYDPLKKALFLSEENYHGQSLAAVGVAAHEAGHALQHKDAYAPLHLRMALVPVVNFASMGCWLAFSLGMILAMTTRSFPATAKMAMGIGIGLFSLLTFFQLVTLPVEIDASSRAKRQLVSLGLISREELPGVSEVLSAAALTYVAALVASALELLRMIMIARSYRSNSDR
ncbi:MAG: zinc metallopeptidase, partial [Verrucomicrobia bacterium]|nr:zinc metallopeptidase [Verrucomicrobiota bacterium]